MKIDYQDISAMIEMIILEAEKEDILISTVDELNDYLQDNFSEFITVEEEIDY